MTESTSFQPDSLGATHATPGSSPGETQLAQAGGTVEATEPQADATTIVAVEPGQALHLDFDPAAAHGAVKDGNLELTFDNHGTVVVQGYEAWAAQGGQATGPQGGAVDLAQLAGQGGGAPAQNAAQVCEIPNQTVVDIQVPAEGELEVGEE